VGVKLTAKKNPGRHESDKYPFCRDEEGRVLEGKEKGPHAWNVDQISFRWPRRGGSVRKKEGEITGLTLSTRRPRNPRK